MTDRTVDVAVVGAGPAGSAAAIECARAGARVLLIDKATFPRDKCCGDGLTTGALRHLDALGLDPSSVPSFNRVESLTVRSPSGRIAPIPLGGATGIAAAVATRRDLDAALVTLALDSGAEASMGQGVESVRDEHGAVVVRLASGEVIRAGSVVAADGAWSAVRRSLANDSQAEPRRRPRWTAFRTYASEVADEALAACFVLFSEAILPGYTWSFPLADGRVNLGVYVEHDRSGKGGGAHAAWLAARADPYLVSLLGPRARLVGPVRAWPIPTDLDRSSSAIGGAVLFAGDALGAADPFTGEGVAQALTTGRAAGRAVVAGSDPASVRDRYERSLQAELYPEHRLATAISRAFARPLAVRAAVAGCALGGATARGVGRWLYEDFPRTALLAPWRWGEVALRPAPFSEVAPGPLG